MRAKLRHHAKFRRNQSNHGRDIAIFRFFKMSAAILDSTFKIFNGRMAQEGRSASPCQIWSKWSNCGQNMAIFQDGGRRHLEFLNF